jgi:hypothetical protein
VDEPGFCPSAPHTWPQSIVFGVVGGSPDHPMVAYLDRPTAVTDDLVNATRPVDPSEVLRIAAPCAQARCVNHDGTECRLATTIVTFLQPTVERLPACAIRARCVWWRQEGRDACLRCPQVTTVQVAPDDAAYKAVVEAGSAAPPVT